MTDMTLGGGTDASAPAPILGSDALIPFADLISAPDAPSPSADPLAAALAAFLPTSGKSLPPARQTIAAEDAQARSPTSGDGTEDDDGATTDDAMWLPLSLDLPVVTAKSPLPVVLNSPAPDAVPASDTDLVEAPLKDAAPTVDRPQAAASMPLTPPAIIFGSVAPSIAAATDTATPSNSLPQTGSAASAPLPVRTIGANSDAVFPVASAAANVVPGVAAPIVEPAAMPAVSATVLSVPVTDTETAPVSAPPSGQTSIAAATVSPSGPAPIALVPALPSAPAAGGISAVAIEPAPAVPTPLAVARPDAPSPLTTASTNAPVVASPPVPMPDGSQPRHSARPGKADQSPVANEARGNANGIAQIAAMAPVPGEMTKVPPTATDSPLLPTAAAIAAAPAGLAPPASVDVPRAPAPQAPVLDTSRADWLDTLVDRVEEARAAGPVRVTHLKLLPDALGALDVRIRVEGERVHVTFTTDSPDARAIIADAAPKLAEMAEARGLRLGQTQVDLGAGAGGSQQRAAGGRDADLPAAPPSTRRDDVEAEPETDAERPRTTRDRLA